MQIGFHLLTQEDDLPAKPTIRKSPTVDFPIDCLVSTPECSEQEAQRVAQTVPNPGIEGGM